MRAPFGLSSVGLVLLFVCAASCGSTSSTSRDEGFDWSAVYPDLVTGEPAVGDDGEPLENVLRVRRPTLEQRAVLDAALRVYIDGEDEAFATRRDELAADPIVGFWLSRSLVLFALKALDAAPTRTEAMLAEHASDRPTRHLVAIGSAAVPVVVLDLFRSRLADRRAYGQRVLIAMGTSVVPAWQRVLDAPDERLRRTGLEVLGAIEADALTTELLTRATTDDDFGVRATAWRGLGQVSPESAPRLRDALAVEEDPFVARAIVEGLAAQPGRENAEALVAHLERALAAGDAKGALSTDAALQQMSGKRQRGTVATWRAWIASLPSR